MKKKLTAIGCAMLVMTFLAFTAVAGNLSAPATIRINSDESKIAELTEANTVLDVYQIASLSGADYVFDENGPFKDLSITEEERTNEEEAAVKAKAEEIAQQALAVIKADASVTPAAEGKAIGAAIEGLETGNVYLVVAHGSDLARADYFDEVPVKDEDGKTVEDEDGNALTQLVTIAQTTEKTYSFLPMLLTVLEDSTELSIDPKYSVESRFGAVRITKTLATYDTIGKATFVFRVTGKDADGATVFSDVAGLTFDGAGKQSVVVERIPVGTFVTVDEVYSGSRYTNISVSPAEPVEITDAVPIDVEITDNTDLPTVEVVNDHNDDEDHGHGITNSFRYNGSSWVWYKDGVIQN